LIQLELPGRLAPVIVNQLLSLAFTGDQVAPIEWRKIIDLRALILDTALDRLNVRIREDGWFELYFPYDVYAIPAQVETMGRCYRAIENTLLMDLRDLAESRGWTLRLRETWTAEDAAGRRVFYTSHAPYQALLKCPLPDRAPAGLRIRPRDEGTDSLRTGHPILDQFVRFDVEDPRVLDSLVENPAFCEAVLELVQGIGGRVELGFVVVTVEKLLLDPSAIWQRMEEVAEALDLPLPTVRRSGD
jgi:hypothetical protein